MGRITSCNEAASFGWESRLLEILGIGKQMFLTRNLRGFQESVMFFSSGRDLTSSNFFRSRFEMTEMMEA